MASPVAVFSKSGQLRSGRYLVRKPRKDALGEDIWHKYIILDTKAFRQLLQQKGHRSVRETSKQIIRFCYVDELAKNIILFVHSLGTIRPTCYYESVESDTVPQRFTTNKRFVSVGIKDFPTPYDLSCAYAVQIWRRLPAKSV